MMVRENDGEIERMEGDRRGRGYIQMAGP